MTDKCALREEFNTMQECYSDPADRDRQVIYIAAEALLDELEADKEQIKTLESRNCQQRGIILSARQFISEYAVRGDAGAEEFVKVIDRAAGHQYRYCDADDVCFSDQKRVNDPRQ